MANDVALLVKSPADTTANQPPAVRDPMIRPGTKFQFDFTDPRCHPGGVITPGVAAVGTVFQSLDVVPVSAVVQANGGTVAVNADGTLDFSGGGGGASGLVVGGPRQFDMTQAEYERLMTIWFKLPEVGYATGFYIPLVTLTPTNNNRSHGTIDMGANGLNPRFAIGNAVAGDTSNGGGPVAIYSGDITRNVVHQLTGRFKPGQAVELFDNGGAMRRTAATTQTDLQALGASDPLLLRVPNVVKMTLYRFGMVDIDASIAAETAYGYPAADVLTGPQHIADDYKFGTGTLIGAPKAAFA